MRMTASGWKASFGEMEMSQNEDMAIEAQLGEETKTHQTVYFKGGSMCSVNSTSIF
jgi:hypothetical protein